MPERRRRACPPDSAPSAWTPHAPSVRVEAAVSAPEPTPGWDAWPHSRPCLLQNDSLGSSLPRSLSGKVKGTGRPLPDSQFLDSVSSPLGPSPAPTPNLSHPRPLPDSPFPCANHCGNWVPGAAHPPGPHPAAWALRSLGLPPWGGAECTALSPAEWSNTPSALQHHNKTGSLSSLVFSFPYNSSYICLLES